MEFGRFSFARSRGLLVFSLVLLCGGEFVARAQQAPPAPPEDTVPALPVIEPISQAAMGTTDHADSANASARGGSLKSATPADSGSSTLRLGPGDLVEVGVYNVPELSTKARVGTSGDVYLPLI